MSVTLERVSLAEPRLGPRERLELLCDEGSLRVIRSSVASRSPARRGRPGDGVVAGAGTVGRRAVFCFAQDASFASGSLGEAHAESIVRVLRLAGRAGAPVVGFVESADARVEEGVGALASCGRVLRETIALSGRVPQIAVVAGVSAGGGAYAPALTDFVVTTGAAGAARDGVSQFVADGDKSAAALVRELLAHLPQSAREPPPRAVPEDPPALDPSAPLPRAASSVYDVRQVARALVDAGRLVEASPRRARNMLTALCRVGGRPVGLVANQPRHLGGAIDAAAAQKAARFVTTCDTFGLPLLVLVDTPGFLPGGRQETAGAVDHGSALSRAFAQATVPKLTVVLRRAYGDGFITMNSVALGADLALAWPGAEMGIVERLRADYASEQLSARAAAREGHIDEVVDPVETRERIETALGALGAARAARA